MQISTKWYIKGTVHLKMKICGIRAQTTGLLLWSIALHLDLIVIVKYLLKSEQKLGTSEETLERELPR